MVAKISHGASLYGALSYNHEKVFQGTAEILSGHRMISDRPGLPSEDIRTVTGVQTCALPIWTCV